MYVLIGKLAQYGVHKVHEIWAEHGDEIMEAAHSLIETIKDGAEVVIDNIGDII